jgi:hypothetical protein
MFNPLTRSYLKTNPWFLRWNKRLRCFVIETWYTPAVFFPLLIPYMLLSIKAGILDDDINLASLVPFSILFIALINKDIFGGQSVVHRLLGYQVVMAKTNKPAGMVRCMLRNISVPLWPAELIFILFYPKRRLGDFIAGTKLIEVPPTDPELILNDIRTLKIDREFRIVLALSLMFVFAFTLYIQYKHLLVSFSAL